MEWFKQQIALYPTEVGLFIGVAIVLVCVSALAAIQAIKRWRAGE